MNGSALPRVTTLSLVSGTETESVQNEDYVMTLLMENNEHCSLVAHASVFESLVTNLLSQLPREEKDKLIEVLKEN